MLRDQPRLIGLMSLEQHERIFQSRTGDQDHLRLLA